MLDPSARDALVSQVVGIVAEVTLMAPEQATEHSQLEADLGVESIDLLDILFKLEEAFGVEIGPPPVFLEAGFFDPQAGNVEAGALTEQGAQALVGCVWLSEQQLSAGQAARYLGSVGALVDLVAYHLRGGLP